MKKLLVVLSCHPLVGRCLAIIFRDRIRNQGCIIDTSGSVSPVIKAYLFWGVYESAEIRMVKKYLRKDLDIIELGSSLGVVASHIARKMDEKRRLFCLEANPELLPRIEKNVNTNARGKKVIVVEGAIDYSQEKSRTVKFEIGKTNLDSSVDNVNRGSKKIIEVPAKRLKEILSDHEISEYALVSDIEGAEAGIIDREVEALSKCRQIIIELHQSGHDRGALSIDELIQKLEEKHGFILREQYGPVCLFDRN